MKKLNQKYFTIAVYTLAVVAFAILFLLLGLNLKSFFAFFGRILGSIGAIFYGILFALVLLPFVKALERDYGKLLSKRKERRVLITALSLSTVYIVLLAALFAAIWFIIPAIANNFSELYTDVVNYLGGTDGDLSGVIGNVSNWFENLFKTNSPFLNELFASIEKYLEERFLASESAGSLVESVVKIVSVLITQLSDIFLGLIISVYLLASRRVISGICGKLVVAVFSEKAALKFVVFFKRLYTDFCAFASSRITLSFFVCAGIFVLSWVAGVPMFSVIVIILFICQLIPTLGTLIGVLISSAIVLILSPIHAIFFIPALIAVELLATYLIMPLFLQKKLRPTHGATAVLVLVGYAVWGLIGAFLAVPIYATLSIEFRKYMAHRLAKKKLPISHEAYEKNDISVLIAESKKNEDAQKEEEKNADGASTESENEPSSEGDVTV